MSTWTARSRDLAVDDVPLAPLLLVNAPPPVHERVVASMTPARPARDRVRDRGRGGRPVLRGYRAAGFEAVDALGTEDEWIALRLSC